MLTRRGPGKRVRVRLESCVELPAVSVRSLDRATGEEVQRATHWMPLSNAVGKSIKVMTFVKWTDPAAGEQVSPGGGPLEPCRVCGGRPPDRRVELRDECE